MKAPRVKRLQVECVRGHEFTPKNTRIYRGKRFCRECDRIRSAADRAEKRRAAEALVDVLDLFAGVYTCTTCDGRYGAEEMFYRGKTPIGKCAECQRIKNRERYAANPEKRNSANRAWAAANRERWLDAGRKSKYGIPYGTYARMLAEQDGGCAICERPEPPNRSLSLDHDHNCCSGDKSCGLCLRGLLCNRCNWAIGLLDEDVERMVRAIGYIEHYRPLTRKAA